jgi:hypothetical protein
MELRKPRQTSGLKESTGPSGSVESRIATRSGSLATSTQLLASHRVLLHHRACSRPDAHCILVFLSAEGPGAPYPLATERIMAAVSSGPSAAARSAANASW